MKAFIQLCLIGILGLAVVGCGDKKPHRTRINDGRIADRSNVTTGGNSGTPASDTRSAADALGYSGAILSSLQGPYDQYSEDDFQQRVDAFVSAGFNPPEGMGLVSGDPNSNTGVRFGGRILFTQPFNPNGQSSGQLNASNSSINIMIWDDRAAQEGGALIFSLPAVEAYVSGNQATIKFQDNYGQVTLEGTYSSSYFVGTVKFNNYQYWDSVEPGANGTLGAFSIQTCNFFSCQ